MFNVLYILFVYMYIGYLACESPIERMVTLRHSGDSHDVVSSVRAVRLCLGTALGVKSNLRLDCLPGLPLSSIASYVGLSSLERLIRSSKSLH
jgi:hypothetical protein